MKKYTAEILFVVFSIIILAVLIFPEQLGIKPDSGKKEEIPVPELMFGLPVDSFYITEGIIQPNQNLSVILEGFGISMATVDQLVRCSEGVFDLRKIKSGQRYFMFQSRDSVRQARYFVYENNHVEYLVFNLADSLSILKGEKEVKIVPKTASGVIRSSLWNAMKDNNLNPMLALDLADIYAWSIDFVGIQKGDRYRVLYEEQFVDSVSVGIGPVYAAEFEHEGISYLAFRFNQDNHADYFDQNGVNLRKAFLKTPLKFFNRISSHFSHSRFHPILRIRRPHHGVDYAAPKGTPVISIGNGTVVERGRQGGAGNIVKIKHNSIYTSAYMHLSGFAKGISTGVHVSQGQVIGYVGSTGLSTGPHLDFRVYKNNTPVDPLKIEAPPSDPVKPALQQDFRLLKDSLMTLLQTIDWKYSPGEYGETASEEME